MNNAPIIITGAAQRIGFYLAKELSQAGHRVVASYRTKRDSINELEKHGVECIQADLANAPSRDAFLLHVKERYPQIRCIIHNASSWLPENKENTPAQTLTENFAIHVDAPYILNLELERQLLAYAQCEKTCADVIHMTDYVVERGSKKHIAYAASKAALANMTSSFATKWAPHVKVNNIAPALLMFNEHDDAPYRKKVQKKSLLPPAPGPQEAYEVVKLILSSLYVTGRTFSLDGGRQLVSG